MSSCSAIYCSSRASKKIEGITFHRYPRDPKRLEQWLEAVNRKDWRPSKHSTLCSLHFEEDMFERNPCAMRQYLIPGAMPTIFPVFQPGKRKITEKSKKQPRDPAKVTLQKEQDPRLTEPLFIGPDGTINKVRLKRGPARQPTNCGKSITPIAVEKVTKPVPWSEPKGNANEPQVTQESENQPMECPIPPQEPFSGVESVSIRPLGEVPATQASEEHPCAQDIVSIALQNAMDETSSNGPEVPPSNNAKSVAVRGRPKKAPATSDGATDSVMKVNLVCPHCQKACKVCLSIKPRPLKPDVPTNLQKDNNPKESNIKNNKSNSFQTEAQVRQLKRQVQQLLLKKTSMRKKVKILQQSVRRLKTRNARLQEAVKSVMEDKEDDLVVIGTINGVLNENDI